MPASQAKFDKTFRLVCELFFDQGIHAGLPILILLSRLSCRVDYAKLRWVPPCKCMRHGTKGIARIKCSIRNKAAVGSA